MSDRLVVLGQGYVGLPLAIRAWEQGFDVIGVDLDGERVKRLLAGQSYVDDVDDEQLTAALASGRYRPTIDLSTAAPVEHAVISVPTPLRDGAPDLGHIEEAARSLAPLVSPGSCVVLESTTYPGTTEELVRPLLEDGSGLTVEHHFFLGYSPERIDPGNRTWTFESTPKLVSGVGPRSLAAVQAFFDRLVAHTVAVSEPRVAELAKLMENTFRHVNIALVNELAMFAHDLDIDVWEAIDAASTKPFGFMSFTPGPGVGGHCLPVDPSYLSWRIRHRLGHTFRFVELANDVNDHMPDYVVRRLVASLNERGLAVKGRRILVLGLSYKRNSGDARESPSQPIIDRLLALGADVRAADPHVAEMRFDPRVTRVACTKEEVAAAEAVVVLVDHDQFDLEMVAGTARFVLDTRNRLPGGPLVERL